MAIVAGSHSSTEMRFQGRRPHISSFPVHALDQGPTEGVQSFSEIASAAAELLDAAGVEQEHSRVEADY